MCYASKVIKEQLEDLEQRKSDLIEESIMYDRAMSKLYHELEGMDLDEKTSSIIANKMQDVLRKRRKAKYDVMQIKTLISQLEHTQKMLMSNEKDYFKDNKNYKQYIC